MATAKPHYSGYTPAFLDLEKGGFDDDHEVLHAFAEKAVRQGFIRKVFGLLAAQLLLTALVAAPIVVVPAVKLYVSTSPFIMGLAMLTSLALVLTLTFSDQARHSHPLNLILLFTFTAAEGVLVGVATAAARTDAVFMAVALTAGISIGLTLYALTTKRDFTMAGGMLFSVLAALVLTGLLAVFVKSSALNIAMSAGGALLFSCYIVYDVQLIVGGGHQQKVSPDEYVLGAIMVYLDIVNLFLQLLRLLSELQRNN